MTPKKTTPAKDAKKVAQVQAPRKPAKAATDWNIVRLAYVHSSKTLAQVARDFGLTDSAVEKRSEREEWARLRRETSETVSRAASERIEAERAKELAAWNDADLRVARALRGQVVAAINSAVNNAKPLRPADVRGLASAAEAAQRIGRLALGATTENTGISDPSGGPVGVANVPLDEYEESMRRFLGML